MRKGTDAARFFSIIIPAFNSEEFIRQCLRSALAQRFDTDRFEVVLVDDCSTDSTFNIATQVASDDHNLTVISMPTNSGPGLARNEALRRSTGDWIVFLDSDDCLHPDALATLEARISQGDGPTPDAVGFDWDRFGDDPAAPAGRRDQHLLLAPRNELISRYLSLQTDGSVIYTAIRRKLITDNDLWFSAHQHEDVPFIFKVYWLAKNIGYVDKALYTKRFRPGSIVHTITAYHIEGFLLAWKEIAEFLISEAPDQWDSYSQDYQRGSLGVIATRIREIASRTNDAGEAASLYAVLYEHWLTLPASKGTGASAFLTKYELIAKHFLETMKDKDLCAESKADAITSHYDSIASKTWSCTDLHHSIFLRPDEVRTCCKRFFVDGKMRGDVSLVSVGTSGEPPDLDTILTAKRTLHNRINSGQRSPCSGCPFLTLEEWGPLETLEINYLSFEYHSVCNLKCNYCSDTYYGGKKAAYDIGALITSFLHRGVLHEKLNVIWGGGEPTIDKDFAPTIHKIADQLPNATQRVLTNSVKHSKTVSELLAKDKITVTTSVDAGTDEVYATVHRGNRLRKVLGTLQSYARINPKRITVKYIFTEENNSIEEIKSFVHEIQNYGLTPCNFQISSDFKKEVISPRSAASMIALFGLLNSAGCRLVFFDDLLRQRLDDIHSRSQAEIMSLVSRFGLGHVLANPQSHDAVAIWGAGWQAKYLLEKTFFFKEVDVAFFVDSTPSKIGGRFLDRDVFEPSVLLESDIPVVIAAVQGFPAIYDSFITLGIDKSRLIRELII